MKMKKQFTLVELIIVMVIIFMLMSIIMSVIIESKGTAVKQDTAVKMKNLESAIKDFKSEYGVFPYSDKVSNADISIETNGYRYWTTSYTGSMTVDNKITYQDLIDTLNGNNSRNLCFLQVNKNGMYKDYWDEDFFVAINLNQDNLGIAEKVIDSNATDGAFINMDVAIWSAGRDGLNNFNSPVSAIGDNNDNLYSWR
jgi:type II secretory pathway pseudopilin PulG